MYTTWMIHLDIKKLYRKASGYRHSYESPGVFVLQRTLFYNKQLVR